MSILTPRYSNASSAQRDASNAAMKTSAQNAKLGTSFHLRQVCVDNAPPTVINVTSL
jgi:hypothetical protein